MRWLPLRDWCRMPSRSIDQRGRGADPGVGRLLCERCLAGLLVLVLALVSLAAAASAQNGDPAGDPPIRIAIPSFAPKGSENGKWAERIHDIVTADLARSRAFVPMEPTAFVQEHVGLDARPTFSEWRTTNARVLLVGSVSVTDGGRLRMAFRLWDVASGKQLIGGQYYALQEHWRRLAHVAADEVYTELTGAPGYFDTRIAFVERRDDDSQQATRLAVMDQDGMNLEYLTSGANSVLSPRFSPVAQQIVYVTDIGGVPWIRLRDVQRGISETVGSFPGLHSAPQFSPDGHRIVMSLKRGGNANLYELDLRTQAMRRLTDTASIDTQPSFSPNGRKVVFVSERSGTRQLYVMRANGRSQQRISRGEGSYSEPVWSPRGDAIAFVKRIRGQVFLCVMKPDGSDERILTSGGEMHGLSWAPNGRVLVFSRQQIGSEAAPQLFTISLSGGGERTLETPHSAQEPSWSPVLGR